MFDDKFFGYDLCDKKIKKFDKLNNYPVVHIFSIFIYLFQSEKMSTRERERENEPHLLIHSLDAWASINLNVRDPTA